MQGRNNFRTVKVGNKTFMCERKDVKALKAIYWRMFWDYGAMLWWKHLRGDSEE